MKGQIDNILDKLHNNEYKTVSEYLHDCYENGYIGTMYDLAGQDIPLIMPIDQQQVVKAVELDAKLTTKKRYTDSEGNRVSLYEKLGANVDELKDDIRFQVSRGIINGSSWNEIGAELAKGMKHTPFDIAINRTITIARTEGHRIQTQAAMDAQYKAKEKGADILKQWDSTLDGRTRDTHRRLDGQIREVDEYFEIDGKKALCPGGFSDPAEDCNCRCALLQRARWALDDEELEELKERAEYFGLDKTKDFDEFKEKYLNATSKEGIENIQDLTYDELKAVNDYKSFHSYVVNEILRTAGEEGLSKEDRNFIENLDSALDKLPSYSGNLQRSLLIEDDEEMLTFMKRHEVGKIVKYDEYLSTTRGEIYNPDGNIQIYIADAAKGKIFSEFESEVLYKRNSEFIVMNVVEQEEKYYILLGEI